MRGDSAYKWQMRRRRRKAKPGAALHTPAGMRSVCPESPGLSPRSGRPMSALAPPARAGRSGTPGRPSEPERQDQGKGKGKSRDRDQSQAGAGRSRSQAVRHGQRRKDRASQHLAGPAVLIAVHDLPPAQPARRPSVILIAGYDPPARALPFSPAGRAGRRPWGSAARPWGLAARPCLRPLGRALAPGSTAASGVGAVDDVKNIFPACKHHFCM